VEQITTSQSKSFDEQSIGIELINTSIEEAVVAKNVDRLQSLYADDFVFTHGTGLVQNKTQWLDSIRDQSMQFISRLLESTSVEVHADLAVVTGRLLVHRHSESGDTRYGLQYLRVFSRKSGLWQLVSHRTLAQWDL